ncbi:MAG: UxaA family hydrolase [Geminicoccaceae bacterium]
MPRTDAPATWQGWVRADGRKGIRNVVLVAYLVECAHHVARAIAAPFAEDGVQLIGFSGCYPNGYAQDVMDAVCTHPNVGAVLLVSLGCEEFDRTRLWRTIRASGRPVELAVIQKDGGTRETVARGRAWIGQALQAIAATPRVPMGMADLVIGTKCGGSDGTSGLTANPAIGRASDLMVDAGAAVMFEELGELFGCEGHMADRAATPGVAAAILAAMAKSARYYGTMEHGSFGGGNITGGLSTVEEKSLGAYMKSGTRPIVGLLRPGVLPPQAGLYLMDMVPDGPVRWGYPNINDTTEVVEMIACGAHVVLFSTGRGSVVGSAVSPVVKVCANPETFRRMADDMDVDAGRIIEGRGTLDEVGAEIVALVARVAAGEPTRSEALGHQEFVLGYKSFEPLGPACFPG